MAASNLPDETNRQPRGLTTEPAHDLVKNVEAGAYPVLPTYITYSAEAKQRGLAMSAANSAAYYTDAPRTKVAVWDEQPVADGRVRYDGLEHAQVTANTSMFQRASRGPFAEQPPSQNAIKANLAAGSAQPFDNSDEAVLSLLGDF